MALSSRQLPSHALCRAASSVKERRAKGALNGLRCLILYCVLVALDKHQPAGVSKFITQKQLFRLALPAPPGDLRRVQAKTVRCILTCRRVHQLSLTSPTSPTPFPCFLFWVCLTTYGFHCTRPSANAWNYRSGSLLQDQSKVNCFVSLTRDTDTVNLSALNLLDSLMQRDGGNLLPHRYGV
jgi:hypothetical protein